MIPGEGHGPGCSPICGTLKTDHCSLCLAKLSPGNPAFKIKPSAENKTGCTRVWCARCGPGHPASGWDKIVIEAA